MQKRLAGIHEEPIAIFLAGMQYVTTDRWSTIANFTEHRPDTNSSTAGGNHEQSADTPDTRSGRSPGAHCHVTCIARLVRGCPSVTSAVARSYCRQQTATQPIGLQGHPA